MRIKSSVLAGNGLDCRFWFWYRSNRCTGRDKHGLAPVASLSVLLVLSRIFDVQCFSAASLSFRLGAESFGTVRPPRRPDESNRRCRRW